MKLTVLVDNNTYIDQYYFGEPALSFYIENNNDKILFDLGYSDLFLKNAKLMNIDLGAVNKIVFSHGHNDHTGGLVHINRNIDIIAHPDAFAITKNSEMEYGSFVSDTEVKEKYNFIGVKDVFEISENLFFMGQIPQLNDFETRKLLGSKILNDNEIDDYTLDDSALVYVGKEGLHIITGCSHSGICNIIEYAKQVFNNDHVLTVIGGFHLFEVDDQVIQTIKYFKENKIKQLYPCHCTSFNVKALFNETIEINEVGVGLQLELE